MKRYFAAGSNSNINQETCPSVEQRNCAAEFHEQPLATTSTDRLWQSNSFSKRDDAFSNEKPLRGAPRKFGKPRHLLISVIFIMIAINIALTWHASAEISEAIESTCNNGNVSIKIGGNIIKLQRGHVQFIDSHAASSVIDSCDHPIVAQSILIAGYSADEEERVEWLRDRDLPSFVNVIEGAWARSRLSDMIEDLSKSREIISSAVNTSFGGDTSIREEITIDGSNFILKINDELRAIVTCSPGKILNSVCKEIGNIEDACLSYWFVFYTNHPTSDQIYNVHRRTLRYVHESLSTKTPCLSVKEWKN